MLVDLRTVNGFVTTRRPARALRQPGGVVGIPNKNPPIDVLLLKMAFETKRGVPIDEHFLVNRSMWRMTSHAALTHSLVLEHERASLGSMAFETRFVSAKESHPAAPEFLMKSGATALNRVAFVRIVTIGAIHLVLENRMMMRQLKLRAYLQVALETGVRISMRINDVAPSTARLHVFASRAVTRFASHRLRVLASGG